MFTNYFGLKANPFSLTADFSFFKIDAPKHAICENLIRDLTNGCSRFIVTGAPGVGKSQLLRYLFTQLPSETQTIFLSGNSLNYSDRIRFIIELTNGNALLGKKSLVVIDNAHEIPEEDLRLLFSLVSQNKQTEPDLPIIFCGLPNLEKRLEPLGFKQIIGDHCSRYHVS
jgi:general secretion pathway protein A